LNNEELIGMAKKARQSAYAPYSNFKVGAALLTKSGNIYKGCNVENASYGLTVCAERVAISNALSNGEKEFVKIAIVGGFAEEYMEKMKKEVKQNIDKENIYKTEKNKKESFLIPCGACMQVMSEFNPDLELILLNTMGEIKTINLKELFPKPFQL